MFADGLSVLVARLRPYCANASTDERAMRILDIATRADFAQVVVGFWAADPLRPVDSDHAFESFDPEDGWQRFRRGEPVALEGVRA